MSKIFDALSRDEGPVTELMLSMMGTEPGVEAPSPERPLPAATQAADPASAPEETQPSLPAGAIQAPRPEIRTLPLRVAPSSPLLPFGGENYEAAERYRSARTKIVQHPQQPRVIVVSSAGPGDGKTVTSINLAGVLALRAEGNVLLIDADFRRSSIHKQLNLPSTPGLAEVLLGINTIEEGLVRAAQSPNLYILPSGNPAVNPIELLDSARWPALAKTLRQTFQYIILDSPPIGAVADYDLIEAVCDGVVLVTRPDHSPRKSSLQALRAVPQQKLLGVVLNCVPKWFLGNTYSSTPYSNYYQQRPADQKEGAEAASIVNRDISDEIPAGDGPAKSERV